MNEKIELEDKTFNKVIGKIIPDSLYIRLDDNEISFEIETQDKKRQWYKSTEKFVVSKVFSLFGISRKELLKDVHEGKSSEAEIIQFIKNTIKDKNRDIVILLDEKESLANVVTKRHKQVPIKDLYEKVETVATAAGFTINKVVDTGDSYNIVLGTGQNTDLVESTVNVNLGRNDSRGRAGIQVTGTGNIFICSNQIIADVSKDVQVNAEKLGITVPKVQKLIHTTNIGRRFLEKLEQNLEAAKQGAKILAVKLAESQNIKISRKEQIETIKLIQKKHNIGEKWVSILIDELYKEDNKEPEHKETLYQLSQAITFVGTHYQLGSENIRNTLCKIGGQVVILGKDFVNLIKETLQEKEEKKVVVETA